MTVTSLPSSPAGELTHGQVRQKINELIPFVNNTTWRELVLEGVSYVDQEPVSTGAAGKINVTFGTGGNSINNEMTLTTAGDFVFNVADLTYILILSGRIGRRGTAGTSITMARVCYSALGDKTDTVELGTTRVISLDSGDISLLMTFEYEVKPANGSKIWIELARDEAGTNEGGLLVSDVQPTGTLLTDTPIWVQATSSAVQVIRVHNV